MIDNIELSIDIPEACSGMRLDQALAKCVKEFSREQLKNWVISKECLVNNQVWRPRDKVQGGEKITIQAQAQLSSTWQAQEQPVVVVYEDQDIIIVNKSANQVVHPGSGNLSGTLVNGLLFHYPELVNLPRAGIVHRLDKDTTGLLVVARSQLAHTSLVNQLQNKSVERHYRALVWGKMIAGGRIDHAIARHPKDRTKMAVMPGGKPAVTHYRVLEKYRHFTYLALQLETGRTHQIRVHLAYQKFPIVGDKTYGRRNCLPKSYELNLHQQIAQFPRQALHAKMLVLRHPRTNKLMRWESPLPADFTELLETLNQCG